MSSFVKHGETERWVDEKEKDSPFAIQYDIPPVREVPVYDPFDPKNIEESREQGVTYNAVNRHARPVETWLEAGTKQQVRETLPFVVGLAKEQQSFGNKADELIQHGYFQEALNLFDDEIKKQAPEIESLENSLTVLLARVGPESALDLVESIRVPQNSPEAIKPISPAEIEFASIVAAGSKEIPNEVKALVLNRANLRESLANEKIAAGNYDSSSGVIVYESKEASDLYYDAAISRMLVGPLPDIYKQGEEGYPAGYLQGLQEKSLEKTRGLLEKAGNWVPDLVQPVKRPDAPTTVTPIDEQRNTGDKGITNILLKRRHD